MHLNRQTSNFTTMMETAWNEFICEFSIITAFKLRSHCDWQRVIQAVLHIHL